MGREDRPSDALTVVLSAIGSFLLVAALTTHALVPLHARVEAHYVVDLEQGALVPEPLDADVADEWPPVPTSSGLDENGEASALSSVSIGAEAWVYWWERDWDVGYVYPGERRLPRNPEGVCGYLLDVDERIVALCDHDGHLAAWREGDGEWVAEEAPDGPAAIVRSTGFAGMSTCVGTKGALVGYDADAVFTWRPGEPIRTITPEREGKPVLIYPLADGRAALRVSETQRDPEAVAMHAASFAVLIASIASLAFAIRRRRRTASVFTGLGIGVILLALAAAGVLVYFIGLGQALFH